MYRYVFFDLDGTLTQSEFGILASVEVALDHFGIREPEYAKLLRFIGPPLVYAFHEYYGLSEEDSEEAVRLYREHYLAGAYKNAPVYEGIPEVLEGLREAGCLLYVVTSKPQDMAERVTEAVGIRKYFHGVIGPGRENKEPSKADLVRRALAAAAELSGSNAEECRPAAVMIGDRHYDIRGAKDAGTAAIGVLYGYGGEKELKEAGADALARTPKDLLQFVLEGLR